MSELKQQKHNENGVDLVFNPDKLKKGANAGNPTLRPDPNSLGSTDEEKLSNIIKYLGGTANAFSVLFGKVNTLANTVFSEAYDEQTGEFDNEVWTRRIAGIAVAGETIGDLEEKIDELRQEAMQLVLNAPAGTDFNTLQARVGEINKRIRDIDESLTERKKAAAEKAAKRMATRQANEAKAQANEPAPVTA